LTPLVLLDRDGVLNKVVVNPEHGTIDSPLHPSQVTIVEGAPQAAARLSKAGYGLVIVSNQPAAAKGKTTEANLKAVNEEVVSALERAGAKVLRSYLCFHRSEDRCACRKPKTALLAQAFEEFPQFDRGTSWMVGDGVTDVRAGHAFGIKTAYIGAKKTDAIQIFHEAGVSPTVWAESLSAFVDSLKL
jgi:histidinol-phosphate phosphatase family protein